MGLFDRREYVYMNEKDRRITETREEQFRDWMPDFEGVNHMSVFGGSADRRNRIVLDAIARAYGKMGVIIIHSNPSLITMIDRFYYFYPKLCTYTEQVGIKVRKCQISSNNPEYEPFYGMSEIRALEAIYPKTNTENGNSGQRNLCEEALRQYFKIIRYIGEELDLDILVRLVGMDINELESIINTMPQKDKNKIRETLSYNDIYKQVRADVDAFANSLEGRIWTPCPEDGEVSDISMIKAAENKAILSIHVNANNDVLNYLTCEIKEMMDRGMRFMLVLDSVNIEGSIMNDKLLAFSTLPFSTVLTCENVTGIFGNSSFRNVLSRMNTIFLMRHTDANIAREYTSTKGQYDRQVVTQHYGTNREAFKLFGSHNEGRNVAVDRFDRITPEEIVNLGDGAIIMDQENNEIIKTRYLIV